ncbi:MAG: hypothetical protein QOJ23_4265, partial [Actinomycetota bacterium]|nr:hypothetical protein [Actinomycetota bacterium]
MPTGSTSSPDPRVIAGPAPDRPVTA